MTQPVTVEKLYQDYVWVIQAFSIEAATVDAWEAVVRDYIKHMNSPKRYLVYDLTPISRPGLTLYMNKRVTALAQDNRDADGRVSIALNLNPTIRYVFEPFIRITAIRQQANLDVKLFGTRDQAINWVVESLPQAIKAAGRE